jgi:Tfp pilus assembly protein PilO
VRNVELKLDKKLALTIGLPVFGLLIGLIGYFVLVSPQNGRSHRATEQVQALEAQLLQLHQKPPKPVSPQAVDLFRLVKAMPDTNDMPGILRDLSRLARSSKVTIQTVTPTAQVPLPYGYGALPLTVALEGKFSNVSTFLARMRGQVRLGEKKLRVTGRLLVPNQIQLTSAKNGATVIATLSLDAFVYGVAPPAPTTTTDTTTTTSG